MATDDELTAYLRDTNTVHIVTTTRDGRTISTPIWAVDVDGASFVRSAYGPDAKWYRRATSNPGAGFETPAGRRAVELEPIELGAQIGDELEGRVDDALRSKYASEPQSLAPMLEPPAHGTTLKVVPLSREL